MQRSRRRWMIALLAVAVLAAACTSGDDDDDTAPADPPSARATDGALRVRLSEGQPASGETTPIRLVTGEPLDDDRVAEIVGQLPPLEEDADDRQSTAFPPQTLPPPVAGQTVDQPFPPPTDPGTSPETPTGPLQVLRHQPDGDVDVAPFLSVTFDQPMVPLATLDQLDATDVPVTITPDLPGRWRWIGTRTLRFEHDPSVGATADAAIDRLPMATEYTVTIPAGTTSATGGELAADVTWTFRTPPVQARTVTPLHDSLGLTPVFVATFDQVVDPDAVIGALVVTADGDAHAVRPATDDEIDADDDAREATSQAIPGRWVAFRPVDPFPAAAPIVITVPNGTPSAEGPRTTDADQTFRARTYPTFTIERARCGWGAGCQPGAPFILELSNPVDAASFDRDDVQVRPEIDGRTVRVEGHVVTISGDTRAETAYEVTLPEAVTDTFGQPLTGDRSVNIRVGVARPVIQNPHGDSIVTVDPLATVATLGVHTIGHAELRLRTFAVGPDDWAGYQAFIREWDHDLSDLPNWTAGRDETIETEPGADRFGETTIDLGPELDRNGHVIVVVESIRDIPRDSPDHWSNRPIVLWVQRTNLGVDALADAEQLVVWTTDLRTGAPVAGARVAVDGADLAATTGADGLASIRPQSGPAHLVVTSGDDSAILPTWETSYRSFEARTDVARWHVLDDRGLYRPGETAHVKGWVRRLTLSADARLAPIDDGATVAWTAHDAFGNEIATGVAPVNRLGGFDLAVEIPVEASLGEGWLQLRLDGASGLDGNDHHHRVRLAEFRRPEFEVTARAESPGPHLVTAPSDLAVTAAYLSGGALADAPVTWSVTTRPGTYSPPGWDDFEFGVWRPWWPMPIRGGMADAFSAVDRDGFGPHPATDQTEVATFEGRTDATGTHHLRVDLDGAPDGRPVVVSANAAVTDVNRQQLADTTDLLVHAATLYVGLRSDRTFVDAGTPFGVEAIVTDIDGALVADRAVTLTAERMEWELVDGEWTEVAVESVSCETTSGAAPIGCELVPAAGGQYRITAAVSDDDGGTNTTTLTRWVSGQGRAVPQRGVEAESLTLVPDADAYADGDRAEVLVQAPIDHGTGLVTTVRNGITATETFEVTDGSAVLSVPITDDAVPGLDLVVEVVGTAPRAGDAANGADPDDLPPRPAYALGTLRLEVPPATRALDVDVTPADPELTPGATTHVDVVVTDDGGTAVEGAELAVVVVDEAVLSLTGHELADPLDSMYARFDEHLTQIHGRRTIALARPDVDEELTGFGRTGADSAENAADGATMATSGVDTATPYAISGDESGGGTTGPITVRTDLDALVVFAPEVVTDAAGRATVEVPLPDSLTRYRVMVTAVDGAERFGSGESNLTARLPVQARPSAPRFLNFGDELELPVVVQNQTDEAVVADVVVEATNLTLASAAVRVEVPANDRVEVRVPAAADDAGTARIRATVVAAGHADAALVTLPVYTPATAEAFATYGVIDDGAVLQPLDAPTGVIATVGGLDVAVSSTSLQTLTDAVIDLTEHPYEHVDAYASRVLAIVALRDVLSAFEADGLPSPDQIDARMADDLAGIARLQNDDGGFGTWYRDGRSDPFRSLQATHALVVARDAGYPVDGLVVDAALARVRNIEQIVPSDWSAEVRAGLAAYALHVRHVAGDRDQATADRLHDDRSDVLGVDGLAWLWPIVSSDRAAGIARTIADRVSETPSAATFTTGYGEDAHLVLASDRRTDGIVLDALIRMDPDSDLVPKVVNGLIANQRRGRWGNVQENAFILLALRAYYDAYESTTPDFVAQVWLGDTYAAATEHRGRSIDTQRTHVAMADLIGRDDADITVAKDGAGRLYYRLGLRYAPESLVLDPRDEGFVVERTYEAIDDPADVRRGADGTWRIRAGSNIRVVLTMVADGRRTNVALVDPVPAGLEILNPDLATAVAVAPDEVGDGGGPIPLARDWWWGTWYDHQNQRDDRAEAYASHLPAGTYRYTYVARATTPGTFVTPPSRAEEIYTPEVFGRSASATVVVDAG